MNIKPKGFVGVIVPVVMAAIAAAGVVIYEKQATETVDHLQQQQKFVTTIQNNLDKYYQTNRMFPVNLNQVDAGRGVLVSAGLVPAVPGPTEPQWRYWSDGKSYTVHYFLQSDKVEHLITK